jgi:mRNA-degrading endonuclease RelE of RelBE toxin-antitoxin system
MEKYSKIQAMKIYQSNEFNKTYKKAHKNELEKFNEAIKAIGTDPTIGESKKGDLAGIQVYKFKVNKNLFLLAYTYNAETNELTLISLGSHENFYRDLKK